MEEEKILKNYREYLDNLILKRTRALRVISLCNQAMIRAKDEQGLLDDLCK